MYERPPQIPDPVVGYGKMISNVISRKGANSLPAVNLGQILEIDNDGSADSKKLRPGKDFFNLADILRDSMLMLIDKIQVGVIGLSFAIKDLFKVNKDKTA